MEQISPINSPSFNRKKDDLPQKSVPKGNPQEPVEQEKGKKTKRQKNNDR